MGVERAVTRWYAQRQLLLQEIASLESAMAPSTDNDGATTQQADTEMVRTLARAREKLHTLGDCPRPMMG